MSGEVRSTWVSFAITLSAQPISYHNQHSLTQPYCNFLPFPLIFCPNEICLIVAFTFILLTCNNTIRIVLLKARKTIETRNISSTKKRTSNLPNQQTKSKFVDSLYYFFSEDELCFHWTIIVWKTLSTDFIDQTKKEYNPFEISSFSVEVQKVFWNTTFFCRQWSRLLSALIFKSFFSKATISWQYKCFSVDKFTKIGRKYHICLEKKVASCDRRAKHFLFLQNQTLLGTKTSCITSTSKTVWKPFLKWRVGKK